MTTRSSSFGSFNYDAGADQARKDNVINETHLYFDSRQPTFKFNKVLGSGAAGVACCVLEWPTPHTGISEGGRGRGEPRRLVVKRAIGPEADRDLWDEVIAPKRFKGAEHIVRLVAASEDGPQYSDIFRKPMAVTSKLWRIARRSPKRSRNSPDRTWTDDYASLLKGLRGPVLVMEYFENGSLGSLREKLKSDDVLLPNRMLWAFCLCVVRACIAHAYPPDGDKDRPNQLERIVSNRQARFLGHGDIHENNIMIGDRGNGFAEHRLVPPLKLIDFGRIRESEQDFNKMIYDLWLEILSLITRKGSAYLKPGMHFGVSTRAVEIQHADPEYCPDGNGAAYPTLDDRLRYFLAHCTAADQARRLSLEQMLATAEAGAERPAEAYGRNARLESDAAVERVLARLLYNADVPMPMSPASPETKKRSFSDDELDDGQTKTKKRKESWNDPLTNIL